MTSETRIAHGSRVKRHGSGRRTSSYQSSSASATIPATLARGGSRAARGWSNCEPFRPNGRAGLPRGPRRLVELAPQLADLVAQPCRVLEAQLLGRGEHLLLELDDRRLDLGR